MTTAGSSTASTSAYSDPGVQIAKQLVQRVSRAFYTPHHSIVIDQLVRRDAVAAEDLAKQVGMQLRDLTKIAQRLLEDQILAVHRRLETKEGHARAQLKGYYYMDYSHATDVIKWRMFKVQATIDVKLRNELSQQGYFCPQCKKAFTTLDASLLVDPYRGDGLYCDVCGTEVKDNENEEEIRGNKDRTKRLVEQTATIRDLLKRLDDVVLPTFNVERWLEFNGPAGVTASAEIDGGKGLQAQLAGDDDEELMKVKRDADAAEKRSQNQLPSWIAQSTVSGELSSVQLDRDSRVPASSTTLPATASSPAKSTAFELLEVANEEEEELDLDSYYASLVGPDVKGEEEGSQSPLSTLPTPAFVKKEEDISDEELVFASVPAGRVSVEETNNGKRGREDDDSGWEESPLDSGEQSTGAKKARFDEESTPTPAAEEEDEEEEDDDDFEEVVEGDGDPNPLITIGDRLVAFLDVDQALQDAMTPEEYTAYWDAYQRLG